MTAARPERSVRDGAGEGRLQVSQVAMCTTDLPATARVLVEALGLVHAGGRPLWGTRLAAIQELPTGADTACTLWWLVGDQEFVQVELFSHTTPPVRAPAHPRSPDDVGWRWWEVTVPDVAEVRAALVRLAVSTGPVQELGGRAHLTFVEPASATTVHVRQALGDASGSPTAGSRVTAVGVGVSDLVEARSWMRRLGLVEAREGTLDVSAGPRGQAGEHVVLPGPVDLVLSQCPRHRPPSSPGALLSDQGLMNIGLGVRDRTSLDEVVAALEELGATHTVEPPTVAGGVYYRIFDGISLEVMLVPREFETDYGFTRLPPFPPVRYPDASAGGAA